MELERKYENTEIDGMDPQHGDRQMVCHPPGCDRNADSCVTAVQAETPKKEITDTASPRLLKSN